MDHSVKKAFQCYKSAQHAGGSATPTSTQSPRRPRLLIVDDEPRLAEFVANAARECDYDPQLTSDDRQFRDRFVERRPDMVALDLGMPGMDGVELLRFLSDQTFQAPVLIISGFDDRVLDSAFRLGEALGLNMVGPLSKPVRLEELEELLNRLKPTLAA